MVQQGRQSVIGIVKTEKKGWGKDLLRQSEMPKSADSSCAGVFNCGEKSIPRGSYIGIYAGELISEAEAQRRDA